MHTPMPSSSPSLFFFVILLSNLVCFTLAGSGLTPRNANAPSLSDSQFYNLKLGLEEVDGSVACFGDFNNDKFTDAFIVSSDRRTITVYTWSHTSFKFVRSSASLSIPTGFEITNVAASDFSRNGKLDVVVTTVANATGEISLTLYKGDFSGFGDGVTLPGSFGDQGLVCDLNNDLRADVLISAEDTTRTALVGTSAGTFDSVPASSFMVDTITHDHLTTLSSPFNGAFVDIDGDCLSDLALVSEPPSGSTNKRLEFWLNKKERKYVLHRLFDLPQGVGQITWADFDRDGSMDAIVPVCVSGRCRLSVLFNAQKPMCDSIFTVSDSCRAQDNLCQADPDYVFDSFAADSQSRDRVIVGSSELRDLAIFQDTLRPPSVRIGDFDLDGYPDLLVVLQDPQVAGGGGKVALLANVACTATICSPEAAAAGRRTARLQTVGVSELYSVLNVVAAAFIDLDEKGSLDVMLLSEKTGSDGKIRYSVSTVYNNFFNDGFFLKALGLNGVCGSECSPVPYSVNTPGVSFKYTIADLNGNKKVVAGAQLTQSAYLPLQLPYAFWGLGRTNDYVEEFFMGLTLAQGTHWRLWVCIIPNSQLIAFPYPSGSPDLWELQLFVSPSTMLGWVAIATTASLILISIGIAYFHWKEVREDQKEKLETAHLFHYDAL
eukprot:GILI01016452.1.p1 GENE.GILI01016452.1~~GILI01016452.1.p1  ORF type:complete len:661 (+),score=176.08 GILI01016452.1:102-2084(+)